MREHIIPVILAGGAGSRLWPLSREDCPKQFLKICGDETMLQAALRRAGAITRQKPIVVTHADYLMITQAQISEKNLSTQLILEPTARGTAMAIAVAAYVAMQRDPNAILFVQTADHVIQNETALDQAVTAALPAAAAGQLMTFGITPDAPATGYGYIAADEAFMHAPGCHRVARFIEKPDAARAKEFIASGYLWNSGMFLLDAKTYLNELQQHEGLIAGSAMTAAAHATVAGDFIHPSEEIYVTTPKLSIDHAVMERTVHAGVVPCDIGWHDIGSFDALEALGEIMPLYPDILEFLATRTRHAA